MRALEVYVLVNSMDDGPALAGKVRRWEGLGVTGILLADHFFLAGDERRDAEVVHPDPFVVLPALGALSPSLRLGTMVANCSIVHPAWVLRHLCHLAFVFGGDRVIAGLGAGWNAEEFEALGMAMPRHVERVERLEESLQLAQQLFTKGRATVEAETFAVRDLPVRVGASGAPRILVGGGSEPLLELAARYADYVDLNGWPGAMKMTRVAAHQRDGLRRLATTTENLRTATQRLEDLLDAAGRQPGSLKRSVLISAIEVCDRADVGKRSSALAEARGGEAAWVSSCPYVLVGPVDELAATLAERVERLQLSALIVHQRSDLAALMGEILPMMSR